MPPAAGDVLKEPSTTGVFWIRVAGDSMRPFLPGRGALLAFEPADGGNFGAGDVVLYGEPGASAVHRVLWKTSAGAWIVDDAGRLPAHYVERRSVRGKLSGGGCPQGAAGLILGLFFRFAFIGARRAKQFFSV